jgi:HTH-type transcriptional regulator/antitoxin MqsA
MAQCIFCGNPEMETKIQDETLTYDGQSITLHNMKSDVCNFCSNGIWDEESYQRWIDAQATLVSQCPLKE